MAGEFIILALLAAIGVYLGWFVSRAVALSNSFDETYGDVPYLPRELRTGQRMLGRGEGRRQASPSDTHTVIAHDGEGVSA